MNHVGIIGLLETEPPGLTRFANWNLVTVPPVFARLERNGASDKIFMYSVGFSVTVGLINAPDSLFRYFRLTLLFHFSAV